MPTEASWHATCRYDKRTDAELFIFDDQTGSAAPKAAAKGTPVAPEKPPFEHGQETVMFPGVNAPMPAGADYALWVSVTC
jgi:hypothetical protein